MELEACFMDDWDLEAIVRGYGGASTSTIINHPNPHQYSFSEQEDKVILEEGFPEFSETNNFLFDDLEDLYKPFYPLSSFDTILSTSLTIPQEVKAKASEKIASQDLQLPLPPSKCKTSKKKKQKKSVVKKVVKEVDGGFGDAWSWRKYGQKPIKGSPYPRSYYKCSSSKGCLARKQVERSHLDPKVFLVTYTASEHNHSQPIRRNSLAGSTRKNDSSLLITPSTSCSTQQTCSLNDSPIVEQSKGLEKEDEGLLEWLDDIEDDVAGLCDGWIPTKELEEFIGLN